MKPDFLQPGEPQYLLGLGWIRTSPQQDLDLSCANEELSAGGKHPLGLSMQEQGCPTRRTS